MSQILGLERAQQITRLLGDESNGVSSVLLYGPRGCGKTLLVNQLIEMWLHAKTDLANRAVDSYRRGTNPDFLHIRPSGPSNIITVGQISPSAVRKSDDPLSLLEYIRVSPLYSRNKAIWIEDVHRLNRNASNSLLKTLEEPPHTVKLILTSSQISQVQPTILSRCLVVNCGLPTAEELTGHYPQVPEAISFLAEGAPGTLEKISVNPDIYSDIVALAGRIVTTHPHQAMVLSEEFRKLSDRLEDVEKQGIRNTNARTLELLAIAISRQYSHRADAVRLITDAHRRIISNANPALVLDAMIGKIVLANNLGTNRMRLGV